jgi:N-acetylmuramate 1-kinase
MAKFFYKILKDIGLDDAELVPLYKDASDRIYYRIIHDSGNLVLMSQGSSINKEDLNLRSIEDFRSLGVRVPKIYKVFYEEGVLIQEDLGDEHLESVNDLSKLNLYYMKAVDVLLNFQKKANQVKVSGKTLSVLKRSFTAEKFLSELRMSTEYFVKKYKGKKLDLKTSSRLEDFYKELVLEMMKQPFLLQHRDYHSRNIMLKKGELFIIDLQDSRLGPMSYDIASLMIDPYINIPQSLKNDCVETYYEGVKGFTTCSKSDFLYFYNCCFLQRGIKILGTFAYQKIEKNNDRYLSYIPLVVEKLKDLSGLSPEWEEIVTEVFL